jgi:hypothetical protein
MRSDPGCVSSRSKRRTNRSAGDQQRSDDEAEHEDRETEHPGASGGSAFSSGHVAGFRCALVPELGHGHRPMEVHGRGQPAKLAR